MAYIGKMFSKQKARVACVVYEIQHPLICIHIQAVGCRGGELKRDGLTIGFFPNINKPWGPAVNTVF